MRLALVHDWLNQIGGAEDVLETLVRMFPEAPLYTSLYWREGMPDHWREWDIRTGFIDKLPLARRKQQLYLPLYPFAFEQFDLRGYDVVVSNKSGFCHGIITQPETVHICYCLTPTRYVWRYHQYAEQEQLGRLTKLGLAPFLTFLRQWDRLAADRVDHFVAISEVVRRRIAKVYRREAVIIHPPVDTQRFDPVEPHQVEDYYFFVGRLVPYRRLDVLIEAFNALGRPLVIAGSGRDRDRLEALAKPNVTFLGRVSDEELPRWLAHCRAFLWPGEEDFGIAPVQAMAAGRPVIAYAAGGALDIVTPRTGAFFHEQTAEAIQAAVLGFDTATANPAHIRAHAEQFDTAVFERKLNDFIEEKVLSAKS
ncbi:MAG: glycosyltransferase [Chloroflexi bacterium]|nr:glycosyltransferase [Chloroflexota bacterium]